jgi:hypothetical protein
MSGLETVTSIALGLAQQANQASTANAQLDAQQRSIEANAARQRQLMELQRGSEERKRRNLLEKATASARASFGARGLSSSDGSASALLSGVEGEFEAEQAERDSAFGLQLGGLEQGLSDSLSRIDQQRQRNLLQDGQSVNNRIFGLLNWGAGKIPR